MNQQQIQNSIVQEQVDRHAAKNAIIDKLQAENTALKAQCESLRNDLLDALDCKNGQGPTALSIVMNAKDALNEQVAQQSDELNSFYNNAKAGFNRQLRDQETIAYLQSKSAALELEMKEISDRAFETLNRTPTVYYQGLKNIMERACAALAASKGEK